MDDLVTRRIANCPTPEYHETHRYCPSCPWTEPQKPQIQVVDLPDPLAERAAGWLRSNQREAVEVRHGMFPLGMVGRWIERAEDAEAEVERLKGLRDEAGTRSGIWSLDLVREYVRLDREINFHLRMTAGGEGVKGEYQRLVGERDDVLGRMYEVVGEVRS